MNPTNTPTSKCCEKCRYVGWNEANDFCKDPDCTCHTPTTDPKNNSEDWEKEFDELALAVAYKQNGAKIIDFDYLKDQMEEIVKPFIRSKIQKAEARGRESIIDTVANLATGPNSLKEKWECCGYHDALSDLMEAAQTEL